MTDSAVRAGAAWAAGVEASSVVIGGGVHECGAEKERRGRKRRAEETESEVRLARQQVRGGDGSDGQVAIGGDDASGRHAEGRGEDDGDDGDDDWGRGGAG